MSNKVLRMPGVVRRVQLSKSTIYAMIQNGDFPSPIKLGARASGWLEADVDAWIESRRQASAMEA